MIRRIIKRRSLAVALIFAAFFIQSCNRGVGCPTKFSLPEISFEAVRAIVHIF